MLAPATAALAQAVAETRGRPPTTAPSQAQPLAARARTVLGIPSFAGAAGVRGPSGQPSLGVSSPDSRPWLHGRGLFCGHNVYYRVLAYFAEFARKVPEGALRSSLSGDERLYSGR